MARFDPGEFEVPELERRVERIEDPDELRTLLAAERLGADRPAAKAAIRDRLASLDAADAEDGADDAEDGTDDAEDGADDAEDGADEGDRQGADDRAEDAFRWSAEATGTPDGAVGATGGGVTTGTAETDDDGAVGRAGSTPGGPVVTGTDRTGTGAVEVDTGLRLRRVLTDWFPVVVAVLVLAALAGGWLTYTAHVEPGTHVEERSTVVFERTVGFDHGASVRRSNSLFPVGTRLSDREVYFTAIAPVLDGSVAVTYETPHGDPVELTTRLTLVTRSVGRGGDGETVYWSVSEPLAGPTTVSVAPGETVRTRFSVNVSEVGERAGRVRNELGTSLGRTEVVVVADLRFVGNVGGRPVDAATDHSLRVEPGSGTYEVTETEGGTGTVRATERVTVENSYGPLRSVGGPMLLGLSVVGLAFLLYGRESGRLAVSDRERETLAFAAERAEFEEWITEGRLPGELGEPVVRTASLEGLVDVAIDTNERVVHDTRTDRYAVLGDSVTYLFERSPTDGE